MTIKTEFVLSAKDDTQTAFRSATASLGELKLRADGLMASSMAGLGGGLAAGLLGAGFTAQIKSAIDSLDKMDEAAERIGLTTESLSALAYAGKMTGVEFEDMTGALTKLSVKMSDAASGDKAATALFKDLGINVKDASGQLKTADTVFAEVANRFAQFEDGAAKTGLAVDLLGKSGARLVPTLNQGAAGLEAMTKEAKALGGIYDGKLAKQAADFNDNLDKLAILSASAGKSIASDILPALNKLVEEFLAGTTAAGGFFAALNAGATLNPFKNTSENIKEVRADLAKMEADQKEYGYFDEARFKRKTDQLNYLKKIQLQEVLANTEGNYGNEGRGVPAVAGKTKIVRTPTGDTPPKTPRGAKEIDAANSLLQSLDKKIAVSALDLSTTEKLTAAEKEYIGVQQQLDSGALKATASQRALIDGKYEFLVAAEKEIENQKVYSAALETANQAMTAQRQKMIESIAVAENQAEVYGLTEAQLSVVTQARLTDALAIAQANGASEESIKYLEEELKLRSQLSDALVKVDKKRIEQQGAAAEQTNEFAQQAARNIQSSLADFLFDPFANGADKMAQKFGQTIQRMAADAAAAQIGKALFGDMGSGKSGGDTGLVGAAFKAASAYFGFANGGIMTSAGPLPLNKYANGGIANSPQLAMFGEGASPEAYVPLPDGRNIPVKMQGQGGGNNITIHVNSPSGDSAEIRRSAAAGARSALGYMGGARRYA